MLRSNSVTAWKWNGIERNMQYEIRTDLVYQATVSHAGGPDENYIGITAPTFKSRLGNHKKIFQPVNDTVLSKTFGTLRDKMKTTI